MSGTSPHNGRYKKALVFAAAVSVLLFNAATTDAQTAVEPFYRGDDWIHDVTVLTVASNGAWGTATREHPSAAIAAAVADCRQRAGGVGSIGSDCGARQVYARKGWSLAYTCGERVFAVSGRTLPEARSAAVAQEIDWREVHRLDIPACRLLVAVGPDGKPAASGVTSEVLPFMSGLAHAR